MFGYFNQTTNGRFFSRSVSNGALVGLPHYIFMYWNGNAVFYGSFSLPLFKNQ